ncbi:MAG: hypothetical protein JXR51_02435 [Bacteroidales bacterium]|nr:hypothetical protein [Bacteroidales bacterium]
MKEITADNFWERVDALRQKKTIKALTEELGIEYESIRVQRTRHRYPNPEHMLLIANGLNTSLEFLLSGETTQNIKKYPARIEKLADKLSKISEIHLLSVENIIEAIPVESNEAGSKTKIS